MLRYSSLIFMVIFFLFACSEDDTKYSAGLKSKTDADTASETVDEGDVTKDDPAKNDENNNQTEDCNENDTRCNNENVEKCVGSNWKLWDDCVVVDKICAVFEGEAQCIDREKEDGPDHNSSGGDDTDNSEKNDSDYSSDEDSNTGEGDVDNFVAVDNDDNDLLDNDLVQNDIDTATPTTGSYGGDCYPNKTCNEGLVCKNNVCHNPEDNVAGTLNSECYQNGTCNEGLKCVNNICEDNLTGTYKNSCYQNNTCESGLKCINNICESQDSGSHGNSCYSDNTCDENHVCDSDLCVNKNQCLQIKEGMNQNFVVKGRKRAFILNLPDNVQSEEIWPVIFNWHGVGDTASNMSGLLSGSVNNQTMPFILVTPENDDEFVMQTMKGIDWDILNIKDGSAEVELFDGVLACIEERWGVDENHIHTTGFSAGAINSNALGVIRGEVLASIFTNSGAYFSNPDNIAAMDSMTANFLQWPAVSHGNRYVQVLMHGSQAEDIYGAGPTDINFYEMAINDADYLNELGHDVIICNHGMGHTISDISHMIKFFKDHPKGTVDSPHSGLDGYPNFCEFRPKNQ